MRLSYVTARNGVTYVYKGFKTWDKERGKYRTKRKCIGKLDPKTGKLIPSTRQNKSERAVHQMIKDGLSTHMVGHDLLLSHVTKQLGLEPILLTTTLPDWRQILAMAYHQVMEQESLCSLHAWLPYYQTPYAGQLDNAQIGTILDRLTKEVQQSFFESWKERFKGDRKVLYDMRSIANSSAFTPSLAWGVSMEGLEPQHIRFALIVGQESELPLSMLLLDNGLRTMDDLSHLLRTLKKQGNTIGLMHLDQEFYSTGRVEAMLNRKYKFVQAVRFKDPWICQLIDQNRDMMGDPGSLFVLDGRDYYMRSIEYHWLAGEGEQSRKYPTTVHLFYSHDIISRDRIKFMHRLQQQLRALKQQDSIQPHPELQRFFSFGEHPITGRRTVTINKTALEHHERSYAGFFAYITNDPTQVTGLQLLENVRMKGAIERLFDNLYNDLDLLRLRIHEGTRLEGRMFIQFLASLYVCQIRRLLKRKKLDSVYTYRELLSELKHIVGIQHTLAQGEVVSAQTPTTERQKLLLKALLQDDISKEEIDGTAT